MTIKNKIKHAKKYIKIIEEVNTALFESMIAMDVNEHFKLMMPINEINNYKLDANELISKNIEEIKRVRNLLKELENGK